MSGDHDRTTDTLLWGVSLALGLLGTGVAAILGMSFLGG